MRNWFKKGIAIILTICLSLSGIYVYTAEEIVSDDLVSEEVPEILDIPASKDEIEQSAGDDVTDESMADIIGFNDELIIEAEEDISLPETEKTLLPEETELFGDTVEVDTEKIEEITETEAGSEVESEIKSETETEIEAEDLLVAEEEENGTEAEENLDATEYALWIDGKAVTSTNRSDPTGDGTFSFDGNKTLTILKNCTFDADSFIAIENKINGLIIQIPASVHASISANRITGDVIKSYYDLTITGKGRLDLHGDIDGTAITINNGRLTISDVELHATGGSAIYGCYSTNTSLKIRNAIVYAEAERWAISGFEGGIIMEECRLLEPEYIRTDGATFFNGDEEATNVKIVRESEYNVWIGDVQVTEKNKNDILGDGGKAKYDPATCTLTFNNPVISGAHIYKEGSEFQDAAVIYSSEKELTVKGTLSLSSSASNLIYATGPLKLNGNFTLRQLKNQKEDYPRAIKANYVHLTGGSVKIHNDTKSDGISTMSFSMGAASLELTNCNIDANSIYVDGGRIDAANSMLHTTNYGIELIDAVFTGSGDTAFDSMQEISISNSTVNISGSGNIRSSEYTIISGSRVSISMQKDGTAIASDAGDITIQDNSTVKVKGSIGIDGQNGVTIQNSTVDTTGNKTYGIHTSATISIKGNTGTITAEGSQAALYAGAGIAISQLLGIVSPQGAVVGNVSGGKSIISGGQAVKKVIIKPVTPQKVKLIAAYNGAHGVGVKWIKLAGTTEYTIWQKYQGVWRSIKTVKPNDSSLQNSGNTLMYTDQTVKTGYGKGYIYSVSAKIGTTVVDYDKAGVAIYRLNPPTLKSAKNSKAGQAVVTWKGVFGRTETNGAYDLQYATEANAKAGKWTNAKKLPGFAHNVTSATITGLKKGTKYVFRIRCSKTNKDRGTFYSEYSPWLSVTVKK